MNLQEFCISINNMYNEWNDANGPEDAEREVMSFIQEVIHRTEHQSPQAAEEFVEKYLAIHEND